jgi:outer membrane protein OmpA-like peptidoglycan-associated protein
VSEILTRRMKEIPCVRFISIGIELEEDENGLSSRAMQDAQAIATQTGGFYVPLKDVREIRGVSLSDSAVVVRSVAFEPRPKPQAKAQSTTATQVATQSTSTTQSATPSTSATQTASNSQVEKPPSVKPQSEQGASQQPSSQQPSSTSQGASSPPQSSSSAPPQNTSSQQSASQQSTTQQSTSQQNPTQSERVTQKDSSSSRTQEKQSSSQAAPQSASESRPQAAPQQPSKTEERSSSRSANRREAKPATYERVQESVSKTQQTSPREQLLPTIADNKTENLGVIRFPIGSAQLTWDSRRSLERLAAEIRDELRVHTDLVIDVDGHSSKEGTSEANLRLSVERAALVARYLRRQTGMREDRVRWTGYGELRPAIDDRFGRQENRRVEIRVYQSRQR